jgi:DNA invertase Pin-like site-specific DNA recombinase
MSTCGNDSAAPAVLYAAKSTEDLRGSIGTQQADCRALAEREGLEVVAEFTDESVSAYSGDRGSGLVEAMATCEELGAERGEAALIIQHSDRLARGDGRQSKHLVEYALWALKHDVKIHSVQDPQTFGDLLYAVDTGQRNHEDSARKSAATRDGLKRRRDRGLPIGAVPEGYIVQAAIENGRPVTSRVVDEQRIPFVMRAMEMVESGSTFGDVSRRFNAEGLRTRRGKQWTTRAIREIVLNPDYTGTTGYPQVTDPERFERIVASVKRLDPVAVQARRKGRKAAEDYLLRGIASCGLCGSSLYTRRYKRVAGERAYICAGGQSRPVQRGWPESALRCMCPWPHEPQRTTFWPTSRRGFSPGPRRPTRTETYSQTRSETSALSCEPSTSGRRRRVSSGNDYSSKTTMPLTRRYAAPTGSRRRRATSRRRSPRRRASWRNGRPPRLTPPSTSTATSGTPSAGV